MIWISKQIKYQGILQNNYKDKFIYLFYFINQIFMKSFIFNNIALMGLIIWDWTNTYLYYIIPLK